MMSSFPRKLQVIALCAPLAALLLVSSRIPLPAQESPSASAASELAQLPLPEPSANALPLPEDRGAADLEQTLKRLGTTASVLFIVPHPDDEDGALMTYLSRGLGVRVTLLTLTRGEGGQNAVGAESYDALKNRFRSGATIASYTTRCSPSAWFARRSSCPPSLAD
jgi:hypothetical protein